MRKTLEEITAEIAALAALKPAGKFIVKTRDTIKQMQDELRQPFDQTSGEWEELSDFERDTINQVDGWREGLISKRPSEGWEGLVKTS